MIKLLTQDKVKEHWLVIQHAISGQLGPLVKASDEQVKEALENELIFCFAILEDHKDEPLRGFVIATVSSDPLTDTFTLLIMCAYAVLEVDSETWADAAVEIVGWAKNKGCQRIMGFTLNDQIAELVEQLGGNGKFRLLTLEV